MAFPEINAAYIEHRLRNQAPRTLTVGDALDDLTEAGIAFGCSLARLVPPGPDLTLAVRHLEDALARGKKAIALNQEAVDPEAGGPTG